jgi:peptidoglycan/xylan/chitin deacetylase (PgdA/CDA1 family)
VNALMYHDIVAAGDEDTTGFPGRDAALYKISPDAFAAHLDAIGETIARGRGGARTTRPAYPARPARPARPAAPAPPAHPVHQAPPPASAPVLTFDDGGSSAMKAAEMLEARGWIGCFFVTANYIGTRGFLTADEIRTLARAGHVIGTHSCSHPLRMGHCPWPQLCDEWSRSRSILSDIIGGAVSDASVPGGDFAPQVAEAAARAGITRLFTSEPTGAIRDLSGLALIGRFTVQRWTSAHTAAALAAGRWLPCARQAIAWNTKKVTKRLGGERYLQLRRLLLRHGTDVQWGDSRQ